MAWYTLYEHHLYDLGNALTHPGTAAILAFVLFALLVYTYFHNDSSSNLPPGPRPLFLFGNMRFFQQAATERTKMHNALNDKRPEYGDIVHLNLNGNAWIFLQGADAIREGLVKHPEISRNRPTWFRGIIKQNGKELAWINGKEWKCCRRKVIQSFRYLGVEKSPMENNVLEEVDLAVPYLKDTKRQPTDLWRMSMTIALNTMHSFVFGKRLEGTSANFELLINAAHEIITTGEVVSPMINLPKWLQKIICKDIFLHHEKKQCAYDVIHKYINDRIKERHENFNSNLIRDYADVHLNLKSETPSRDNYQVNSSFELITTIFATGVVSISNALMWTILYMQEYPDVQNKCRDVLNEICGHSNVYWSDRKNVPYIEAVIMEINRLSSNVPFTVSHTSEKETTLLGFTIPKKSVIRANLYSAHMDPRYWEEPHVFNPDRFLKDEKLIRNPAYMPFGIGPRKCVAHRMSELIQFVTFSNLVRRVSFEREDPNETHTFQLVYEQVTSRPIPFKTISTVL